MNETVIDLRGHRREGQIVSADGTYPAKCVRLVRRSFAVAPSSARAKAGLVRETAGTGEANAPALPLWRLTLASNTMDRVEMAAYILLAVGSAVSLLNGFWRLDHLLVNWASFVELAQRVFS